jgi:hypothetical protein
VKGDLQICLIGLVALEEINEVYSSIFQFRWGKRWNLAHTRPNDFNMLRVYSGVPPSPPKYLSPLFKVQSFKKGAFFL